MVYAYLATADTEQTKDLPQGRRHQSVIQPA